MAASIEKVQAQHQMTNNVIVHDSTVFTIEYVRWVEGTQLIEVRARKAGTYNVQSLQVEANHMFETLVVF